MRLDESAFRTHLSQGAFQSGADRGRWRLLSIDWPFAVIVVSAAERERAPNEFAFRFELSNYPVRLPTARPWDAERNAPLPVNEWPSGANRVQGAFNPGYKGGTCLYLPCDREAFDAGHQAWRSQHPEMIWTASSDITHYLRIIYDLLQSRDYKGIGG
jgi:hypothetical protein